VKTKNQIIVLAAHILGWCAVLILIVIALLSYTANAQSFEVVDKPAYYYITIDGDTIVDRFTKESKAILKAGEASILNPSSTVRLLRPNAEFTAKNFVHEFDLPEVHAKIDSLKTYNQIQGLALEDIYTNVITELERKIDYLDSLNRKKIEVLKTRLDNLFPDPLPDPNLIDFDSISIARGGWIDNGNKTYTYNSFPDDLGYLVFGLKQDLIVGKTYTISFDTDSAMSFNMWLYIEPDQDPIDGYENPSITSYSYAPDAITFEFEYTVEHYDRVRFGIRARNDHAPTTISNVKIIEK
jgi:hypothetical protein